MNTPISLRVLSTLMAFVFASQTLTAGVVIAQPAPDPFEEPTTPAPDPNAPAPTPDPNAPAPTPTTPAPTPAPTPGPNEPRDPNAPWSGARDIQPPAFLVTPPPPTEDGRPRPTEAQLAALAEMEAEVDRLAGSAETYVGAVTSLLRREHHRQRRTRTQFFTAQISTEERALDDARLRAIQEFERFIRRYPNDPVYTPDAMFRLGELYYERSSMEFQRAADAAEAAAAAGTEAPAASDVPDFSPTVDLYTRLIREFPNYARLDGVYYVLGYCLNEMGQEANARAAWLALVCHNRFTYPPEPPPVADPAAVPDIGAEDPPFVDPYTECTPVTAETRFVSETWFRIGENHFDDYGAPNAVDLAISAYSRILVNPEDRNYSLALYKIAWAYYRASRYPEAIRHFGLVVQWSDEERARTGRAGSDLRPEAIQYLAVAFEYDDWNENMNPDTAEGMPSGLARAQDRNLMPQDREWTPEVFIALGQAYLDNIKYDEAIAAWTYFIEHWPNHPEVPHIRQLIAGVHRQRQNRDAEFAILADMRACLPQSDWWDANRDNPAALRLCEELAQSALIQTAIESHQSAQRLRRACSESRDMAVCAQADEAYRAAASGYREYLRVYPNNPQAYELQYNLADALFWSGNYEEAATVYAAVRDSNLDNAHLSEAARRVVESLKKLVDDAAAAGRLTLLSTAPPVIGEPPNASVRPLPMPELVQRLAQAREMYLARVDEAHDTEHVRASYDYNNALLLYWYGYWPQARDRLTRIFEERCVGALANETGQVAWESLRAMALALGDNEAIRNLATQVRERGCTFRADVAAGTAVDCDDEENADNPMCLSGADLNAIQYREALAVFERAQRDTNTASQRTLFEQSATMLLRAVNENPEDPQAPIALEYAARALELTARYESAGTLYQRILDEVGPRRSTNAAEQTRLDAIVSNAYFRLAFNAQRFFDFPRALESYRTIAESPRFASSQDPAIRTRRVDALVNTAVLLQQLNDPRASEYYRRVYDTVEDATTKRNALFQIAMIALNARSYADALRAFRDFITRYGSDNTAGELVVEAYWHISEIRRAQNDTRNLTTALQDVVSAFDRSRQPAGSMAAEYAANARFLLVDASFAAYEGLTITMAAPSTGAGLVAALQAAIGGANTRTTSIATGYEPIVSYRRPQWTIAAFVRQGRAYEVLRGAVRAMTVPLPPDIQRAMRSLPQEDRELMEQEFQDQVRAGLDTQAMPIECLSIVRFALAARAARAGNIDNEYTRQAITSLSSYGEERIGECIAQQQATDPTFQAYQAGEFSRAPRGQNIDIRAGVTPPALAREE